MKTCEFCHTMNIVNWLFSCRMYRTTLWNSKKSYLPTAGDGVETLVVMIKDENEPFLFSMWGEGVLEHFRFELIRSNLLRKRVKLAFTATHVGWWSLGKIDQKGLYSEQIKLVSAGTEVSIYPGNKLSKSRVSRLSLQDAHHIFSYFYIIKNR